MRILLDECVPRPLGQELVGHEVQSVQQAGWSGKKNGELLALMTAAGFEILLTTDQNLAHQQNLTNQTVAVLVLSAISNRLADLTPLVPAILGTLDQIKPGELKVVSDSAN